MNFLFRNVFYYICLLCFFSNPIKFLFHQGGTVGAACLSICISLTVCMATTANVQIFPRLDLALSVLK